MIINISRFNIIRCFLISSIGLYGLLQYNLILHNTDVDKNKHHGSSLQHFDSWLDEDRISSVDYFGCCGAGHRLSKLSDAYYVSKQLKFSLRVFFGFCNNQEVYSYLFGSQPLTKEFLARGTPDMYIKIVNEVPGFKKIIRQGNTSNSTCPCVDDHRLEADVELFNSIRDRFRDRERIEIYRSKNNFVGHTVIGLHIRAGNGEQGDFIRKNRTIQDITVWCQNMAYLLTDISKNFIDPPILFIATDTGHIISRLRELLKDKMDVIYLVQDRLDDGQGVLFGAKGDVIGDGDECMNGWLDSFTDMILLSHADVVVAGRPSSFTQGLPMTLALSKKKSERKVKKSFCEVNMEMTAFMCFEDLKDWCCNGNTSFSLHSIQKYDYRRMPELQGLNRKEYSKKLKMRPRLAKDCIPTPVSQKDCLPYSMPIERNRSKLGL